MPLDHTLHMFRAFERTKVFNIGTPSEKLESFNPPFTYNLSQKHVKNFAICG